MTRIENYRIWFEHEKWANQAMLAMIESVPESARSDERFARATELAGHLAACRENWLAMIAAGGRAVGDWWPGPSPLTELRERYAKTEAAWIDFLAGLSDEGLDTSFDFLDSEWYRGWTEDQIAQLVGHAHYHRGQIALLVDQLGGQTVDTDYVYWVSETFPDRWHAVEAPDQG